MSEEEEKRPESHQDARTHMRPMKGDRIIVVASIVAVHEDAFKLIFISLLLT